MARLYDNERRRRLRVSLALLSVPIVSVLGFTPTSAIATGAPHSGAANASRNGASPPSTSKRNAAPAGSSGCTTGGFATCGGFVRPGLSPDSPAGSTPRIDQTGSDQPTRH